LKPALPQFPQFKHPRTFRGIAVNQEQRFEFRLHVKQLREQLIGFFVQSAGESAANGKPELRIVGSPPFST